MNRRARRVVILLSLLALVALGGLWLATSLIGVERPGLGAENGTNTPIELFLGDESLGTVDPGTGMEIASRWRMPSLPWEVEARTEDGRVVVSMTVTAEKLAERGQVVTGVDLPGGRFSMWAGY